MISMKRGQEVMDKLSPGTFKFHQLSDKIGPLYEAIDILVDRIAELENKLEGVNNE
jgi:hypothetical protein